MKSGMYHEIPGVKIGNMSVWMMTDKEDESHIWMENKEGEGSEFHGKSIQELEKILSDWFDKNF